MPTVDSLCNYIDEIDEYIMRNIDERRIPKKSRLQRVLYELGAYSLRFNDGNTSEFQNPGKAQETYEILQKYFSEVKATVKENPQFRESMPSSNIENTGD